jgi:hypothetical protein
MYCIGNSIRHRWIRKMTDKYHHRVGYGKPLSTDWCLRCKITRSQINKQKKLLKTSIIIEE